MIQEYEAVFLFSAQDTQFKASLEKVKALFTEKGVQIKSEEDMKIRKLAYEVKGQVEGHYWLFRLNFETRQMKALNDDLRLFEDLLKYLFVKIEYKKPRYSEKARKPKVASAEAPAV